MTKRIAIQVQHWREYTRYILIHECGSVFLDLYPEMQESFGGTAYIWGLYVDCYHRRKSIGKALLEEAERCAKLEGHKSVILEWEEKNTSREILNWYIRCNYNIVGYYRDEQYTLEKKI